MKASLNRCGVVTVICLAVGLVGVIDQPTMDALKVGHILRTIATAAAPATDRIARSAEVTESELNAYIAHRLAQEQQPLVKRLTVSLLDNNHVNGTIQFDAEALKLETLMGVNLDFDFKGIIHTRDGAARLELITLNLCGQPVNPQVFDFVIHTASLVYHMESSSIDDWYELPKGVKHIMISRAKAVLHY